MKLKVLVIATALLAGSSLASAMTSWSLGSYTVTYDETTSFGSLANAYANGDGTAGFHWNFDELTVATGSDGSQAKSVALPEFTVTANPGYTLSGAFNASLGDLDYRESGAGATTTLTATGKATIDAGPVLTWPASPVARVPTSGSEGYYRDGLTVPVGTFSSFHVFDGGLSLAATVTGNGSASISLAPHDELAFSFNVMPSAVPEPQTYALLLAGLGALGFVAKRRGAG